MAARTAQGANALSGFRTKSRFEIGLGTQLPEAYKKFWREWRVQKPAAVHYQPKEGLYERNELTGEVKPIQNIPIPVIYPREHNLGIWGGEGIVKGFQKRNPTKRRVPHFWVPVLKKSAVFSEVLNEHFSVVVTNRTLELIHDHHGFDHYILKTPACDLKSTLALTFKRKILQELEKGCPNLENDKNKQIKILNEYKPYLNSFTSEEIEWYGFTFNQAIYKLERILEAQEQIIPHKVLFRSKIIEQLKQKLEETENNSSDSEDDQGKDSKNKSWLNKIIPFGSKKQTT